MTNEDAKRLFDEAAGVMNADPDRALSLLDELDAARPNSRQVTLNRGLCLVRLGRLDEAQACRDRLAGDGAVVVKVPNYACLARRFRGRRWCGYRWPDHVNYFTPATLAATARAAGLRVVRMSVMDRNPVSDSLYAVLGRDPAAVCADEEPRALRLAV